MADKFDRSGPARGAGQGSGSDPAKYLAREIRRERQRAKMTLAEFGQRVGYDPAQLSRMENGHRPITQQLVEACDRLFPHRNGWFTEFYREAQQWIVSPPWFRPWLPYESTARELRSWTVAMLDGLIQHEDYARDFLGTLPGATPETVTELLAARMRRQRVLLKDGASFTFLVDRAALDLASAAQLRHLVAVAALPAVTLQIVPAAIHTGLSGSFVIADSTAAYTETSVAGIVYEDPDTIASLVRQFGMLQAESMRASESVDLLERMASDLESQLA